MEPYALLSFYRGFLAALRSYDDWDGQSPIEQAMHMMFDRDFAGHSEWIEPTLFGRSFRDWSPSFARTHFISCWRDEDVSWTLSGDEMKKLGIPISRKNSDAYRPRKKI